LTILTINIDNETSGTWAHFKDISVTVKQQGRVLINLDSIIINKHPRYSNPDVMQPGFQFSYFDKTFRIKIILADRLNNRYLAGTIIFPNIQKSDVERKVSMMHMYQEILLKYRNDDRLLLLKNAELFVPNNIQRLIVSKSVYATNPSLVHVPKSAI